MNILSCFDGISCGQIALNRAGIKYDKYFSAEIDKHAIKVTQTNYPNTIQLGDITKVNGKDLPKIYIIFAGSPCQGFSTAGKGLNFEDPRSKLFFEFVRLLKECQPKYFFLENVVMKKEYQDIISNLLGTEPILINSSLVSAQNRRRLYWTNIPNIQQPQDKNIKLKNILETKDSYCVGAAKRTWPRYPNGEKRSKRLELRNDDKSNCLTSVQDDCLIYIKNLELSNPPYEDNFKQHAPVNIGQDKYKCLVAQGGGRTREVAICDDKGFWRKMTPIEIERLQTVDDGYTSSISDNQRYKCLGNGWTVDVIAHILSFIPKE